MDKYRHQFNIEFNLTSSFFIYLGVFLSALRNFDYKEFAYEYEILSLE